MCPGPLLANNWAAIKTTAGLVKQTYPMGVILDFADVSVVSRLGEITFVEALFDIERESLPFVLDNVPDALAGRLESLLEEYQGERSPEAGNAGGRDTRAHPSGNFFGNLVAASLGSGFLTLKRQNDRRAAKRTPELAAHRAALERAGPAFGINAAQSDAAFDKIHLLVF